MTLADYVLLGLFSIPKSRDSETLSPKISGLKCGRDPGILGYGVPGLQFLTVCLNYRPR